MLIIAIVVICLFMLSVGALLLFVAWDLSLAGSYKIDHFFDRLLRKMPPEQYLQLVALPLCGAIAGGFISTAFSIFLDHPLWKADGRTYIGYALVLFGLVVITAGPLAVHALNANPKNLTIAKRIDQLTCGDWTRDSKADLIETIDKQQ